MHCMCTVCSLAEEALPHFPHVPITRDVLGRDDSVLIFETSMVQAERAEQRESNAARASGHSEKQKKTSLPDSVLFSSLSKKKNNSNFTRSLSVIGCLILRYVSGWFCFGFRIL